MSDFDPYHQWLAIPPSEQPPNHYRLLGVTLFEPDLNVIDTAANQKMAYLHTCATGEHADLAEQLTNAVSKARLCLSNEQRKSAYDRRLRQKQNAANAKTVRRVERRKLTVSAPPPIPTTTRRVVPKHQPTIEPDVTPDGSHKDPFPMWFLVAGVLLGAVMLGGAGVFVVVRFNLFRDTPQTANADSDSETEQELEQKSGRKAKQSAESQPAKLPQRLTNSVGMQFVLIPAGEFEMGAGDSDQHSYHDERPRHKVRISRQFYMGQTEVTQAAWKQLMSTNPSPTYIDERPVTGVTWSDAAEFCRRLSTKDGHEYRLPTEAEWEYACRARSKTAWSFGDSSESLGDFAWCNENAGGTRECGEKYPNGFGLFDMHGNASEWCQDWFDSYSKSLDQTTDPTGPSSSALNKRVHRGGDYGSTSNQCRCSYRDSDPPAAENPHIGFRVVRVVPAVAANVTESPKPEPKQSVENQVGMSFVLIRSGEFNMGTASGFGFDDEKPQHRIKITKPFYLGKYEVSVGEFEQVMSWAPVSGDPNEPVSQVTFEQAETFCRRLCNLDNHTYRLPTEAEWEFACRAGSETKWSFGDEVMDTARYAWYSFNSTSQVQQRGSKLPNDFGLYDMHGNVSEWCVDWYKSDYYEHSPNVDPRGPFLPQTGRPKIIRGGSFEDLANSCRSAFRHTCTDSSASRRIGFRVVREISD